MRYLEVLQRVALEDGIHLRTSSSIGEIHVAPISCAPEDDAWDITHTFLKADRVTGMTHNVTGRDMEGEAHVSRHATSMAMVNEGGAGGPKRQHDDD